MPPHARFGIVGAFAALLPAAAHAAPSPAFIPEGAVADAPNGFVEMCARDAALCRAGLPDRGTPTPVRVPAPTMRFIAVPSPVLTLAQQPIRLTAVGEARPAARWLGQGGTSPFAVSPAPTLLPAIRFSYAAAPGWTGNSLFSTGAIAPAPAVRPAPVSPVRFGESAVELQLLRRINTSVNRAVVQVPDMFTAGVEERWERPGARGGDCEDIAIAKREALLAAGFPADRMFYAVAYLSGYGLHTVLVVRLADGDRLLDSLSPHVLRWSEPNYRWLRVQSTSDPMVWSRIGRTQLAAVAPARGG